MTNTPKRAAQLLILLVALGQPVDILTTNAALASVPGAFENNPVEAFLMLHLGGWWWVPKATLAVFLVYQAVTLRKMTRRRWALVAVGAKAYALVLIANYWHLR